MTLPTGEKVEDPYAETLAEKQFERGYRADDVSVADWRIDLDAAPLTGQAIAIKFKLRRLASQSAMFGVSTEKFR